MSTKDDVYKAINVLFDEKYDDFGKIYYSSNEDLFELFSNFDFKDKSVLTVLASGDQYFLLSLLGAANIDSFDSNRFTKYYFYLRKWNMELFNKFLINEKDFNNDHYYFYRLFTEHKDIKNFFDKNFKFIIDLVDFEDPNEIEALDFWVNYVKSNRYIKNNNMFIHSDIKLDVSDEVVPDIIKSLEGRKLNFLNINLFKECDFSRKYDFVITSNISEYATDKVSLGNFRDNLDKCLNDDGIVICSHFMLDRNDLYHLNETKIMSEKFDCVELDSYIIDRFGQKQDIGYVYKKRC